uniref:SAM-dependent MTase RsmB/NOP-type domain-containing protein n=1 Tax=Chrysotila carterae TaxID=13221 RepID=A0A7S4BXZ1_CHRCT|mmetsp:Transcript_21827/g.46144  ORF Transcript_21827/g.46144 Transcript_21827/m.46144 type:complete len:535 (+) Transcript_21827:131-1735(+)
MPERGGVKGGKGGKGRGKGIRGRGTNGRRGEGRGDGVGEKSKNKGAGKLLVYEAAAAALAKASQGEGVRSATYQITVPPQLRPTVALLIAETRKAQARLDRALEKSKLLQGLQAEALEAAYIPGGARGTQAIQAQADEHIGWLAKVLMYDMFVAKKKVKGGSKHAVARAIWARSDELTAWLAEEGDAASVAAARVRFPRYARVNTLRMSVADALRSLQEQGIKLPSVDPVVKELLVFPPGTNLHGQQLVTDGALILQDRASCLPALALAPPEAAHVIDACAAPGNKTTQLAAMVGPNGVVHAFEKSFARAKTLRAQLKRAGAVHASAECVDFLTVDPHKYPRVTHALVDASCSGSGGAGGHELRENLGEEAYWARVARLASVQEAILRHVMAFPSVQTVVYSTCSVHEEENEAVVRKVARLEEKAWKLVSCLPAWPTRGLGDGVGKLCVRAGPADLTHGFFVARLERVHSQAQRTGAAATDAADASTKRKPKKRKQRPIGLIEKVEAEAPHAPTRSTNPAILKQFKKKRHDSSL